MSKWGKEGLRVPPPPSCYITPFSVPWKFPCSSFQILLEGTHTSLKWFVPFPFCPSSTAPERRSPRGKVVVSLSLVSLFLFGLLQTRNRRALGAGLCGRMDGVRHAGDWPGRPGTASLEKEVSLTPDGKAGGAAEAGLCDLWGGARVALVMARFTLTPRVMRLLSEPFGFREHRG